MQLDPEAIRTAVRAIRRGMEPDRSENFVLEHDLDYDAMYDLFDPLVEAYGAVDVVESLRAHKQDPDLVEALFFVCWNYDHNLLTVFTEEEVVEAAREKLLQFGEGTFTDTRGLPHWGWSALAQHHYDGDDHLTDEQAFRILLKLVERVPLHDKILWMIGDGPFSHAWSKPGYRKRIEGLVLTEPKIARAVELVEEETLEVHYILRSERPPRMDSEGPRRRGT
jgi:hypothetical protein